MDYSHAAPLVGEQSLHRLQPQDHGGITTLSQSYSGSRESFVRALEGCDEDMMPERETAWTKAKWLETISRHRHRYMEYMTSRLSSADPC